MDFEAVYVWMECTLLLIYGSCAVLGVLIKDDYEFYKVIICCSYFVDAVEVKLILNRNWINKLGRYCQKKGGKLLY
jgi:hypothetical protein